MHIKIVGFKCHLDTHYDFEPNLMILLKGATGAGKSTILQAIFWGLYGAMRGVYNNTGVTKKCSVTLQINQLTVYRQKGPELLRVTILHNNLETTYEDEIAQQIINQAFGSRELWKSCSYIVQKERCSLLSGTSSERLTLLNQLSFNQDNPKDYISRIDQELKTVNTNFINIQAGFTVELNLFTQQISERPVIITLSEDNITQMNTEICDLTEAIETLYGDVLGHERNIGSYNTIISQIKSGNDQLNNLVVSDFNEDQYNNSVFKINTNINSMKNIITNANHYDAIKQQANSLKSQINTNELGLKNIINQIITTEQSVNNIKPSLGDITLFEVTEQMIWEVSQQETLLAQNINESQTLGCKYDQVSINNLIGDYQHKITEINNMERNKRTYDQLKLSKQKLSSMGLEIDNLEIDNLETTKQQIITEISELKKGLELLQCPECSKPLRYHNKQLIPGERDPVDPSVIQQKNIELQTIINQIGTIRSAISLNDQIKSLESQLVGIDIDQLENCIPSNVSNYQTLISRLSRVQINHPPLHSSDLLKTILNYNQTVKTLTNLTLQRDSISENITELKTKLSQIIIPELPPGNVSNINATINQSQVELGKLHSDYQNYLQIKATRDQLVLYIEQLNQQKVNIEKLLNYNAKTLHEVTKNKLTVLEKKLDDGTYGNTMILKQSELEITRRTVIDLNTDLTSIQRLKQNAIEVECKQLQDTVDTINSGLGDILPLFFNEPITMILQLYKTLKTKKEVKPGLNISIKYKGVEYDNINQLSGGEGDRISLALVLALNSVSNSPIILLDECISSLDGAVKESCVDTMNTLIKSLGKTIICVDHEGVEGFYDKTITID